MDHLPPVKCVLYTRGRKDLLKWNFAPKEFSEKDFEEVFTKSESLVKKYYSCYPFLMQICVLWLNHYMLATEQARQQEILGKIEELCTHISENCKETGLCNDVVMMKATVDLFRGNPEP